MKILWLAHRDPLNPKVGGDQRVIFGIGTRLVKYGYGVTLITAGWRGWLILWHALFLEVFPDRCMKYLHPTFHHHHNMT
ncbi:MAG: hypothetical protein QXU18_01745 [Thermoplasmatales archaeon]